MNSSISNFSAKGWSLLLAAFLLTTVVAWQLLRVIYDQPNWKTLAIKSLSKQHALLFLGSSRVFFGINPNLYHREAMNLACDYMDGQTMLAIWKTHERELAETQVVVLEGGLAPYYYQTRKLAPESMRDLGLGVRPTWQEMRSDPTAIIRSELWPFFRWRLTPRFLAGFVEKRTSPNESMHTHPGYVPSQLELTYPAEFAEREIQKAKRLREDIDIDAVNANRGAIDQLIDELLAAGRQVVWLRFPVHREVWSRFPADWQFEVESEKIRLAKKFPSLVVIDLWDRMPWEAANFRDPDHLNTKGATRLAEVLNAELVPLFP